MKLSSDEIRQAFASIGEQPWAVDLYADEDACAIRPLGMTLLPPAEALALTAAAHEAPVALPRSKDAPLLLAWARDSDAVAVFTGGTLAGMVAYVDHDEVVPVPRWVSVRSFLAHAASQESKLDDWRALRCDLPDTDGRAELLDAWLPTWEARPSDDYAALVALQFTGTRDGGVVRRLLNGASPWVQERACEIAGCLQLDDLAPVLEQRARDGRLNVPAAAIKSLRKLRSTAAKRAVHRLQQEFGSKYDWCFRDRPR